MKSFIKTQGYTTASEKQDFEYCIPRHLCQTARTGATSQHTQAPEFYGSQSALTLPFKTLRYLRRVYFKHKWLYPTPCTPTLAAQLPVPSHHFTLSTYTIGAARCPQFRRPE